MVFSINISFILIKFKKVLDYVLIKYRFDLRKDEKIMRILKWQYPNLYPKLKINAKKLKCYLLKCTQLCTQIHIQCALFFMSQRERVYILTQIHIQYALYLMRERKRKRYLRSGYAKCFCKDGIHSCWADIDYLVSRLWCCNHISFIMLVFLL